MPLNAKGEKIKSAMEETYGSEKKAKSVLYASKNKGTISNIDQVPRLTSMGMPDGVLPTPPPIEKKTGIPTSPPMIPGADARPPDKQVGTVRDYAKAAGGR